MSVDSTLTVTTSWQPIFAVSSTGYISLSIVENFSIGRRGVATLNTFHDESGNLVTVLIDCRGFFVFDPILPSNFSLDGVIIYSIRVVSNILEVMVASGSYSLSFSMFSASQTASSGPQGPQGPDGLTGAQGPQGPTGPALDTSTITYSSNTTVAGTVATTYLQTTGVNTTEINAQRILSAASGGELLTLNVFLSVAPGVGTSRIFTIRINGVNTVAVITIAGTATTGQWIGGIPYATFDRISIQCTRTGTPATTIVMASLRFSQ